MTYTLVAGASPLPDEAPFYRALVGAAAHVVAADAAGEWCIDLGRTPDIVVGDFDSALPGAGERLRAGGAEVLAFPAEKDVTDLEIAVEVALERYGTPLVLTAAFSGLLDHTLAALGTLVRSGEGAEAREPDWTGHVVTPAHALSIGLVPGTTFSVVAIGEARGVTVSGAHWPLVDTAMAPLSGLGVSNVTSGDELAVSVEEGTLIVLIRILSGAPYTL